LNLRFSEKYKIKNAIEGECSSNNSCWVLTDKGLFNYKNIGLSNYPEIKFFPGENINQLSVNENRIWVATNNGKELKYLDNNIFKGL